MHASSLINFLIEDLEVSPSSKGFTHKLDMAHLCGHENVPLTYRGIMFFSQNNCLRFKLLLKSRAVEKLIQ